MKQLTGKGWLADVNLFLVVLMWGVNLPIMKFALSRMDRFAFNAFRLTLSALALGAIVYWLKLSTFDRSEGAWSIRTQVIQLVLFALLTAFGYQVLFLLGIDATSAGNTGVILSAIPMWIAILSFLFLKERLGRRAWTGLSIAFGGVMIVTLYRSHTSSTASSLTGNLLVSGAALCWAVGSVYSKPMLKNISPVALTFASIALTVPLHYLVASNLAAEFQKLLSDGWLLAALFYSGVFSTGFATAMWNIGVKQVGPSHAAGFQNLVPLIALGSSWLLIGEVPVVQQLAGGALIIVGLITLRMKSQSNTAT